MLEEIEKNKTLQRMDRETQGNISHAFGDSKNADCVLCWAGGYEYTAIQSKFIGSTRKQPHLILEIDDGMNNNRIEEFPRTKGQRSPTC